MRRRRNRCRAKMRFFLSRIGLRRFLSQCSLSLYSSLRLPHRFRQADVHAHAVDLVDDALAVGRPVVNARRGERRESVRYLSVSAFRLSRLARPLSFRELSAPAIQSSRRARAFSSLSAFAMSTLTRNSPCRTGERCEKRPYGRSRSKGEKAKENLNRSPSVFFF